MVHYADAVFASSLFSFVRDERRKYDLEAKRARDIKTNALRAENEKLATEIADKKKTSQKTPRLSFQLAPGLIWQEVDDAIARGLRLGDVGHRTVAFYLADCADRGLFQEFGFSNVISYAERRHKISRRSAREFISAGRTLRDLVKIDQAFKENKLNWTKVRAIVRVADVTTEEAWLAFALLHGVEVVERESKLAKKGELPGTDRKGVHEVRFDVRLRVSALGKELFTLARQRLAAELGRYVTDEEFTAALVESFLRKPSEGMQSSDSLYRAVIDMRPAEGTATVRTDDGPVPIDAAMAAAIACDAGVVTEDGHEHPGHVPPIPDSLRKKILARDGYRCACGSGRNLHVHHIVFRSKRGSNKWSNLLTICSLCHALVHGGYLSITGEAPRRIEMRDRNGKLLDDPQSVREAVVGNPFEISLEGPPPSTGGGGPTGAAHPSDPSGGDGAAAPSLSRVAAEKVAVPKTTPPAKIDREWLLRHRHLISVDRGQMAVRMEDGVPRPTVPELPADDAANGERAGDPLRPVSFDEIVGQKETVERLRTYARAARNTGRKPQSVLLLGATGLGKTTLARAYAHELGSRCKIIDSTTIDTPLTLISHMLDVREGDVVFLDESHAIPRNMGECFYPAIEDGFINLQFVDGVALKSVQFVLPKITFVAATTNPERMPSAFRDRFRKVELRPYGIEDLTEIIRRAAARDGLEVAADAALVIAKASAGTARIAIGLYTEMRTLVEARAGVSAAGPEASGTVSAAGADARCGALPSRPEASAADARAALAAAQMDENGLDPVHHRILDILRKRGRPLALRRLAAQAGITAEAFRSIYEPALVACGAVVPTPRGMMAAR